MPRDEAEEAADEALSRQARNREGEIRAGKKLGDLSGATNIVRGRHFRLRAAPMKIVVFSQRQVEAILRFRRDFPELTGLSRERGRSGGARSRAPTII